MICKATAIAPANIAFIKYWGAKDLGSALPYNPSISMTLSHCFSRCTVEHREVSGRDEVRLTSPEGELRSPAEFDLRVRRHLERIRCSTGCSGSFKVATENSFPSEAGLASSASGFAALTVAATRALGLDLTPRELSSLARLSGSGSAARSVLGGFVEWPAGHGEQGCYAIPLANPEDWDLRDVIALVDTGPKLAPSVEGHRRAPTSPYFKTRQELLPARLQAVRDAIARRDLEKLGPILEEDAIDLHLIAMSSKPPIFYWKSGTVLVLEAVRRLRSGAVPAYATLDAGPNVHVLCPPEAEDDVAACFARIPEVKSVIRDAVGVGPHFVSEHLF